MWGILGVASLVFATAPAALGARAAEREETAPAVPDTSLLGRVAARWHA